MPDRSTPAPAKHQRSEDSTVEVTRGGGELCCPHCDGRDLAVDRIYVNLPADRRVVGFQASPLGVEHIDGSGGCAWLKLCVKCQSCGEDIDLALRDGEARIEDSINAVQVRWSSVD